MKNNLILIVHNFYMKKYFFSKQENLKQSNMSQFHVLECSNLYFFVNDLIAHSLIYSSLISNELCDQFANWTFCNQGSKKVQTGRQRQTAPFISPDILKLRQVEPQANITKAHQTTDSEYRAAKYKADISKMLWTHLLLLILSLPLSPSSP